ncbi:hypothetical protein ANI02nite_32700 [Acetobacter nitrogenifigens DSM 23921 = NBRC 105050]|uniref:Uncharacterized protein n=1 Tax=Acetobacter nitrogenifigens DSM 23921 = NBRC 105050 TaxID=1120919 RepID=A0A511XEL9_9PROT|nr:hypothetical protein ANI02nite_32700 [Acetobacter nitrogenifigens DSM 23921 = NBRC 105050]
MRVSPDQFDIWTSVGSSARFLDAAAFFDVTFDGSDARAIGPQLSAARAQPQASARAQDARKVIRYFMKEIRI